MSSQTEPMDESASSMLDAMTDCIKILAVTGEIRFINPAGLDLMEATVADDLLGKSYPDLWPVEQQAEILQALIRAAHGETVTVRGHCATLKQNRMCWETHFSLIAPAVPPVEARILAVSREITATIAYATDGATMENHFSKLLAAAFEGICEVDAGGTCKYVNPAAAQMLGYDPAELIGQNLHDVLHHHYADGSPYPLSDCPIYKALQSGLPCKIDDELLWHKSGFPLSVACSVVPVGESADAQGAIVTFADNSEKKRASQDLKRLASELAEAERRKTEFIATLAHELRNPLAPVRSGLQIIARAGDDKTAVTKARTMMERQLEHLVKLINDLLDVARLTSGKIPLTFQPVDLSSVLNSAVEATHALVLAGGHSLKVQVPDSPVPLHADPIRLTQVFTNLLDNATKYTPAGGQISVTVGVAEQSVRVSVADSGIGMSTESLSSIFDLFTRVGPSANGLPQGLGIGLNLARKLVEMHAGYVVARSKGPGQGSAFIVVLPLAQRESRLRGPADVAPGIPETSPRRIMVVDDNVDAAETLSILLQTLQHRTLVASSGAQALAAVEEFKPDIVFLDIGMPGMNGYEVAAAIRSMPRPDGPLLVALTGWGTAADRERSRLAGFDAHLTKPVDFATVERLITSGTPTFPQ